MKPYHEWDEAYILKLPPGEHDWIEFKDARSIDFTLPGVNEGKGLDELSKQISAFANSGGGAIVYGIKNTRPGAAREVDDTGGVTLSLKNGVKEWLEDVIHNLVDPPLVKFNVYTVEGGTPVSKIGSGKALLIVEIPSSASAPHQAKDNVYYGRVAGKSRPLGHHFVIDIINRPRHPKMKLTCRVDPEGHYSGEEERYIPTLWFSCRNIGRVYANYVNGFVWVPAALADAKEEEYAYADEIDGKPYVRKYFDNTIKEVVGEVARYRGRMLGTMKEDVYASRYDPVLPSRQFGFSVILRVPLDEFARFDDEELMWEVYADNSPLRKGVIKVADIVREN
jgi:hypothetical protein